jgi:hypothetical protein
LDLAELVNGTPEPELPALIGDLARAQALALARIMAASHNGAQAEQQAVGAPLDGSLSSTPLCLTIADAAAALGTSTDYMARLARQGKVPVVRLPALTKGKGKASRTPEARAVRISVEALRELIRERTE